MRSNRASLGGVAAPAVLAAAAGCSAPAPEASPSSPDSIGRARAMADAVRAGDPGAAEDFIGLLESEDPATRLLAIQSLEALTGATYGYRPLAPERERDEAVRRWREAAAAGEF